MIQPHHRRSLPLIDTIVNVSPSAERICKVFDHLLYLNYAWADENFLFVRRMESSSNSNVLYADWSIFNVSCTIGFQVREVEV
ncbi:hypothetical protein Mpal_1921 [Methanosphaerula palustris E1-9c]|uniref:Uncharacterized protein n=1 Tax=Methanosphaerula palustris (strain ATCC BAA-1556 / DSM 19958 / E1-9c) TaxID=521011 RepID=B8GKS9_METPE|nr:hypothetical protein Mpal_1921 [Methanosphaerula palustris E1-9c]